MARLLLVAVAALNVGISAHYRRRARLEGGVLPRRRESTSLILVRIGLGLPVFLLLLGFIVVPGRMHWAQVGVPAGARWLGAAVGLVSALLNLRVLRALGPNVSETVFTRDSHRLITHGPYRRVRHPLYTVGFFLLGGLALLSASWLLALLLLIGIPCMRWIIVPREEAELVARFGDRYREYRRRTGALLPRLGSR